MKDMTSCHYYVMSKDVQYQFVISIDTLYLTCFVSGPKDEKKDSLQPEKLGTPDVGSVVS